MENQVPLKKLYENFDVNNYLSTRFVEVAEGDGRCFQQLMRTIHEQGRFIRYIDLKCFVGHFIYYWIYYILEALNYEEEGSGPIVVQCSKHMYHCKCLITVIIRRPYPNGCGQQFEYFRKPQMGCRAQMECMWA